jgi:hypothetical protein
VCRRKTKREREKHKKKRERKKKKKIETVAKERGGNEGVDEKKL